MIVAVDVQYGETSALASGVSFDAWTDEKERSSKVIERAVPAGYQPGHFFERELPCILPLVRAFLDEGPVEVVVIDGYVDVGVDRPGLGRHLFDALDRRITVIGVAKNEFVGAPGKALLRGESKSPLYVTSTGDVEDAVRAIACMAGEHRIPTLLKRVDRLARGDA